MATVRFFEDDGMDFAVRCVLSGVRYGMAEVGEVFATCAQVVDGDPSSWYEAWVARGRWAREIGDECAIDGHHRSAWGAYLRAANYLYAGAYYAPASSDPSRFRPTWGEHRVAWDRAVEVWPSPAAAVTVPFGDTTLPAYWFEPGEVTDPGPVVVLVGGIDAPISDAVMTGLVDGTDRGYRVLCIEGPGQGQAFFGQGLALRPDWEQVVGAALDWLADQAGADLERLVLMGVNHGGYLVARAASRLGGRVAAMVLDPGVRALTADDVAPVNDEQRPPADTLDAYALTDDDVAALTMPVYVADPAEAMGYVGQPAALAAALDALGHPVVLDRFTADEGAALDCEIQAPQVRNQRVYDWLDARLRR
jgi:dienelactone hydrolase